MYNERVATQQLTVKADPKLSFRERREAAKEEATETEVKNDAK